MKSRIMLHIMRYPFLLIFMSGFLQANIGTINEVRCVVAYGEQGAYAITFHHELLKWDQSLGLWIKVATATPDLFMMDSETTGNNLLGIDTAKNLNLWNQSLDPNSVWTKLRLPQTYQWVNIDETHGKTKGKTVTEDAWQYWDEKTPSGGEPWYEYSPVKNKNESDARDKLYLLDKRAASDSFHMWEETDLSYFIELNKQGAAGNYFDIHRYITDQDNVLDEITSNPDNEYNIRLISLDEKNQNLWGVDSDNKVYQWYNPGQYWILRNLMQTPDNPAPEFTALLTKEKSFTVETTMVTGFTGLRLIIDPNRNTIYYVQGLATTASDDNDIDIVLLEEITTVHRTIFSKSKRVNKIVRDFNVQGKTQREDGMIENLLIKHGVVGNISAIETFPGAQMIYR